MALKDTGTARESETLAEGSQALRMDGYDHIPRRAWEPEPGPQGSTPEVSPFPNQYHLTWASIPCSSACRRRLCKDATDSLSSTSSDSTEF